MMQLTADAAGIFSTCGKRQYACMITDERFRITGMGYNGGPSGMKHCVDGGCPRFQEGSANGSVYDNCIAQHAEMGALINRLAQGTYLYVNGPPCYGCAKVIVNSGIKEIFYLEDSSYAQWPEVEAFMMQADVVCYNMGTKEDYASQ